jgi:DNA-binding XRE family transcriptional regulator
MTDMDAAMMATIRREQAKRGLGKWPVNKEPEPQVREYQLVPAKLTAYRKARHLNIFNMAKKYGIPKSSLQAYEAGDRLPRRDTLFDLADKLGCYVYEIAEEVI